MFCSCRFSYFIIFECYGNQRNILERGGRGGGQWGAVEVRASLVRALLVRKPLMFTCSTNTPLALLVPGDRPHARRAPWPRRATGQPGWGRSPPPQRVWLKCKPLHALGEREREREREGERGRERRREMHDGSIEKGRPWDRWRSGRGWTPACAEVARLRKWHVRCLQDYRTRAHLCVSCVKKPHATLNK